MASEKVLSLKLVVNKQKNSLVFAEAEKDFVDVLFSFLTLPIGAIVRLLDKKSYLGCMDKLYEVVENLDSKQYFRNEVCKSMLLFPRSAAENFWKNLKIKVDDLEPWSWYGCPKSSSHWYSWYSLVPGVRCTCKSLFIEKCAWSPNISDSVTEGGAFLKSGVQTFIITDDLQVMSASTVTWLSLREKFGINDASVLEERTVQVGRDEILSLLKRCLSSRVPLSDVFLRKHPSAVVAQIYTDNTKVDARATRQPKAIKMKILEVKYAHEAVYAETGEDFIDLLFSFLTLPLGTIIKLLNNSATIGSVNSLYKSIELLGDDCFKSKDHKQMLVAPKLAPHFDISNQILKVAADFPYSDLALNPKLMTVETKMGGGFVKEKSLFIVTKELNVLPFSKSTGLKLVGEMKIPITKLAERAIGIGEIEALELLRNCLSSMNPLNEYAITHG